MPGVNPDPILAARFVPSAKVTPDTAAQSPRFGNAKRRQAPPRRATPPCLQPIGPYRPMYFLAMPVPMVYLGSTMFPRRALPAMVSSI